MLRSLAQYIVSLVRSVDQSQNQPGANLFLGLAADLMLRILSYLDYPTLVQFMVTSSAHHKLKIARGLTLRPGPKLYTSLTAIV